MTILAAYNATAESVAALEQAARLADAHHVPLRIFRYMIHEAGESPTQVRHTNDDIEAANRELEDLRTQYEAQGVPTSVTLTHGLRDGVAAALLAEATDIDADIIVMGFVPRPRIAEFVLGSVARQVVNQSTCPVMAVKAAG